MKDPKGRYLAQKHHAIARGVEWQISFDDWHQWWKDSGHYHERGRLSNEYCMCRKGDTGPYSLENIYCATVSENISDSHVNNRIPKMQPFLGRSHSEETKKKMSNSSTKKLSEDELSHRLEIMTKYDFSLRGALTKFSKELQISHTQARRFIESVK